MWLGHSFWPSRQIKTKGKTASHQISPTQNDLKKCRCNIPGWQMTTTMETTSTPHIPNVEKQTDSQRERGEKRDRQGSKAYLRYFWSLSACVWTTKTKKERKKCFDTLFHATSPKATWDEALFFFVFFRKEESHFHQTSPCWKHGEGEIGFLCGFLFIQATVTWKQEWCCWEH